MPLAKKTSKNEITLPKKVANQSSGIEYFDVRCENGAIVLYPVALDKLDRADRAREKLEALGITDKDIGDAIASARDKKSS